MILKLKATLFLNYFPCITQYTFMMIRKLRLL